MKRRIFYLAAVLLPLAVFAQATKLAVHDKAGLALTVPADWSVAHGDDFLGVQDATGAISLTVQVVRLSKKSAACAQLTKIEWDYNDKRKNMLKTKERLFAPQRLKSVGVEDGCQGRYFFKDKVLGNHYEEYQVFTDSKKGMAYQVVASYPEKLAAAEVEKIRSAMNSFKVR